MGACRAAQITGESLAEAAVVEDAAERYFVPDGLVVNGRGNISKVRNVLVGKQMCHGCRHPGEARRLRQRPEQAAHQSKNKM